MICRLWLLCQTKQHSTVMITSLENVRCIRWRRADAWCSRGVTTCSSFCLYLFDKSNSGISAHWNIWKMERWCTKRTLYTVGTCISLWLCLSVTTCWQMQPQAIILCPGHASLHLILLLARFNRRSQEIPLSQLLLVPVVNYCHHMIAALTSFYSHTKDTFCHLWLL